MTSEQSDAVNETKRRDQNAVLRAMLKKPGGSLNDFAKHLIRLTDKGQPNKRKVQTVLTELAKAKLVEKGRDDHYILTKNGRKEAETIEPPEEENSLSGFH
jgi:predicted transcriptional regulator